MAVAPSQPTVTPDPTTGQVPSDVTIPQVIIDANGGTGATGSTGTPTTTPTDTGTTGTTATDTTATGTTATDTTATDTTATDTVVTAATDTTGTTPATVPVSTITTTLGSGGSLAFIDTIYEAQAARLYQAAFNRAPDQAGLAYWTNALKSGTPLVQIAGGFLASAEAKALYGTSDNSALVTSFYENVLHRAPDAAGTAYWTNALNKGTATVAQVLVGFSESIENKANTPDAQTASVARLYYAELGRAPDAAGLSYWTSKLGSGATLVDEASALARSTEFTATYGALDNTGFVSQLYENVLGRAADAAGLAVWTRQLAAGTSRGNVVVSFSESAEFKAKFVATIAQNGIPLA
jgi:hypothetical protein